MDPSIINLLEEDEDETMHPVVVVDAFTEVLNGDIQGEDSSKLQDSACDVVKQSLQSTEQHLPHLARVQKSFSEQNFTDSLAQQIPDNSEEQGHKVQQLISPVNNNLSNDHKKRTIHTSSLQLDILVPEMLHLLDKDQSTQLHALYSKLLNNEISNEHFVRVCKVSFGDRVIREAVVNQVKMQFLGTVSNTNGVWNLTALKKPSIGKKRILESSDNSPPQSRKKQKTSVVSLDQSIEQLNDVTAVSGVNLKEEEEQLLSTPKEEAQASNAVRRVALKEEERLILQKGSLQRKLEQIISRCGLEGANHDVEHFLSMCVEERLRSFIISLIRLSKQRIDVEMKRHKLLVTSDVQHQILAMNQKAKEEWEKKLAEKPEKFRKLNDTSGNSRIDAEKDKDDEHSKVQKSHREEVDKMRATAANVAARAAIGIGDMLSKWQLVAKQARQKREGKLYDSLGYKQDKSSKGKLIVGFEEAGGMRRSTALTAHPKFDRTISMKDVLATLEREPQMSRSTLVHRLHGRTFGNVGAG
ncbi:hypothetical protein HPP92_012141 [Vanilla planifolia]|uniref:Uncharacterized protein n=1 Tax=Vanilla planifolia TaxID=51239 RepID=A0A835V3H1_VANPL|nr:hypothetical protein HPP92_012141 [Vanilla planifolia]